MRGVEFRYHRSGMSMTFCNRDRALREGAHVRVHYLHREEGHPIVRLESLVVN